MSGNVETWRSRPLVQADCNTCGEKAPGSDGSLSLTDGYSDVALTRFRRWARTHAERNLGHLAVVESFSARCYEASASVAAREGTG